MQSTIHIGGDCSAEDLIQFRGYTADVFDHVAVMPCIGNHDDGPGEGDEAYYNQLFTLPRSEGAGASGTEDFYYFMFGNTIVVSLSTQTFKGGEVPFADQAAWLDQVLTENPKRWKIVMLHHPSYTYGIFVDISSPPNEEGQNAALTPILEKHHVDVVVTSHNHWYERYEPSACATQGDPGSDQPCSVGDSNYADGTVYLVSGGAGAFTIPGVLCGGPPGRAVCSGDHHYLVFDVTAESLTMEAWGAAPQPNDRFDIMTITKPPPASCDPPPPPDAGPGPADAGWLDDSGTASDGGPGGPGDPSAPAAGCCRVGGASGPVAPGHLVLAIGVALLLARRRRSSRVRVS